MSRVSRGRPTIIDKIKLDIPDTEKSIVVQYVGSGDTVQIELPGVWDMSTYLPQSEDNEDLTPSMLLVSHIIDETATFDAQVDKVELINGTMIVTVSCYQSGLCVCSFTYPSELQWSVSLFERSALGDAGRTRVELVLDRDLTDEETDSIKSRIKLRRSRSTVKS